MNLSDAKREVEAFFRTYGKERAPRPAREPQGQGLRAVLPGEDGEISEVVPRRIGSIRGSPRGFQGQPGED